jgi:hypothetical protein
MIDVLIVLSQRPIVTALAVFGAGLVIAGSLAARTGKPGQTRSAGQRQNALSRGLTRAGYTMTCASILLFIIAGFISDLRP